MTVPPQRVLFLCTGNYYRSRFAEHIFNHLATAARLPLVADSAGLAPQCWTRNPGDLSPHTVAALRARNIAAHLRPPRDVAAADFAAFTRIIAMKEAEHRPMVEQRFGGFAQQVQYWAFDDIEDQPPEVVVPAIEARVRALLVELTGSNVVAPGRVAPEAPR
ncbi:MAG: low molecular weight phosphatase family protein [Deltaproteobacteria bacterium]|nr:low molecular weight phosphatase family protein [Deltaproteobacteria bacterium]